MRYYDHEHVLIFHDDYHGTTLPGHDDEQAIHAHEFLRIESEYGGPIHGQRMLRCDTVRGRHFAIHEH